MQFTTILAATLTLIAAPTAVLGWAKAANGVWVANNHVYPRVGNFNNVHESCTRMNSNQVYTDDRDCAYWANGQGEIRHGHCLNRNNRVECVPGCRTYEVCNISNDDGSCSWGVAACLEKMGCSGHPENADCLNFGCAIACK